MTTPHADEATITASAQATVPVPCDVAWVHVVLVEEAKIVSDAIESSAARIALVLDRIRETEPRLPETVGEVERKIEPLFGEDGDLDRFRIQRVVRAQMPPEPAGPLLDVAIMAGAGPGSKIVFGMRDPAAARARAIDAALGIARTNAAGAAQSLGCELGNLCSTTVESEVPEDFPDPLLLVSANVTVVYARKG